MLALGLAACSNGDENPGGAPTTAADTSVPAADTSAPAADTTAAPDTTAAAPAEWEAVTAPADCMCSDGSGFEYYVKKADPAKVLLYFEGGGACFDRGTCGPESDSFSRVLGDPPSARGDGIFDDTDARNPFAGWSIVYVPYCTGDVHMGNTTTDYGDGVVIQHKGYVNATTATKAAAAAFPDATQVAVVGESAGGVAVPLYAGVIADLLPEASITAIADSSGAYPDIPGINAVIGAQWGTMNAVPDWPENEGMTVDRWSIPGLFVQAGRHAPRIVFGRHDFATDRVQSFFSGLAGIPADDMVTLIDQNAREIRDAGVPVATYVAPGSDHTVFGRPGFYTETVGGVLLVDWVTSLVTTGSAPDVHCDDAAGGCDA